MTCCFIGHRKINDTPELRERLQGILQELIDNGTSNFIFGDHSAFNSLCYDLVTELKEKYPTIKRINFRKDYEDTNDYTMQFLIAGYEESICPKGVGNAGRASYVERNQAMIRESDVWLLYSILKKWGDKTIVATSNNQFRLAVPLIATPSCYNPEPFLNMTRSTSVSSFRVDDLDNIDKLLEDIIDEDFLEDFK